LLQEVVFLHGFAFEEGRIARVFDLHAAHHLADDDLDVLVVDRDALRAVHLLDAVDEV
jgi:hypothetical protein